MYYIVTPITIKGFFSNRTELWYMRVFSIGEKNFSYDWVQDKGMATSFKDKTNDYVMTMLKNDKKVSLVKEQE